MIDFSQKVNFLKPNIQIDYNKITRVDYDTFVKLLANKYKLVSNQVELFNGLSSSIYSILKFLNLKYCFIYSPCALEYKKAAKNLECEVRVINRFENLFLPIKDKSVVVFANPSYLDGTYYDLENLLKYWISKEATVIVDETLLDFCKEVAAIKYLNDYEKLYIIKDFSKYYSNENLLVSAIFSNEKNISCLRKFEPENKLSNFDMKYLKEALKDIDFAVISNSVNIKNKIELEKIFHSWKYLDFLYHSSSNSILIKLKYLNFKILQEKLKENNIRVSSCLQYDFIDESFFNIYVSSKDNIVKFKGVIYAI